MALKSLVFINNQEIITDTKDTTNCSCALLTFIAIALKFGDYIYCHTVAICDHARPPVSTKMVDEQYEYALRDMDEGRYEYAK